MSKFVTECTGYIKEVSVTCTPFIAENCIVIFILGVCTCTLKKAWIIILPLFFCVI